MMATFSKLGYVVTHFQGLTYFLLKLVPGQVARKKDLPGRIKQLSTTMLEA